RGARGRPPAARRSRGPRAGGRDPRLTRRSPSDAPTGTWALTMVCQLERGKGVSGEMAEEEAARRFEGEGRRVAIEVVALTRQHHQVVMAAGGGECSGEPQRGLDRDV